ncbi:MAG TPA: hypothetical protein VGO11_21965 [Chthoniobacteraceae bacterium]|jgi:hypothetical protein|nr:hypothetical protein [Chthoniobacteraceae bacterium]
MAFLSFALILFGLVALCGGMLWFIITAFRTSVLWGICVCLFTPAWIRFAWRHWDVASQPFFVTLVGLALSFGGAQLMPKDAPPMMAGMALPFQSDKAVKESKKKPELPAMLAAQKEMELKIKLTALSRKETVLRDRKAAIDPHDQPAVTALQEEIIKYNAELQPLLAEMKARGMQADGRPPFTTAAAGDPAGTAR